MKNLKISMKLLLPHIVILLILLAGIIISSVSFINIRKKAEALYHGSFVVKIAADTIHETFETMQISIFRAISNDSQDITDEAIIDARNCARIIQEHVAQIKQNIFADTDILTRLEKYLSELTPMQEHVLYLVAQNRNSEAMEYMKNENIPVIKAAQKELTQLIQSSHAKELELVASLRQIQKNAVILLTFFGSISMFYIWRFQKKRKRNVFSPMQMS